MTELDEILASLVANVDGTLVAAVGGLDGLLVEQHPSQGLDLANVAAEVTILLGHARSSFDRGLDGGEVQELIVTAERLVGYVRLLDPELFCLLVMNPGGNLGKARIYSEQAARQILEVFA